MAYNDIADMKDSNSLRRRLYASAAEENKSAQPEDWVNNRVWQIVGSPGWSLAWASAVAGGITDPGADEGVISDGMILAVIQPMG